MQYASVPKSATTQRVAQICTEIVTNLSSEFLHLQTELPNMRARVTKITRQGVREPRRGVAMNAGAEMNADPIFGIETPARARVRPSRRASGSPGRPSPGWAAAGSSTR